MHGREDQFTPGEIQALIPGGIRFWGKVTITGEVSTVNDDETDNVSRTDRAVFRRSECRADAFYW
jgi:D-lyxose ketol-isomerase